MTFLIISHVLHYCDDRHIKAYAPYVREINLWLKHVEKVEILAPMAQADFDEHINLAYKHSALQLTTGPAFSVLGLTEALSALSKLPGIVTSIYKAMKRADHIHLRCPGNMGLLGCLVQVLFPSTPKTVKYAGNWDPNAKQPWSYNLQKWILSHTVLTRNMRVLVYGHWPNQTKNITPFFTASYHQAEIQNIYVRNYAKTLHFCFVGSLSQGKRPLLALDFVEKLRSNGRDAVLHIYGDGELKADLQQNIRQKTAEDWAFMYGNQPKTQIKNALKYSHFLILPSKSEGWPKAVAEAMFWGCIPIATKISCVPWMLGYGERGYLLDDNLEKDVYAFKKNLGKTQELEQMSTKAAAWSRQYTLDKFEAEITKLINK